MKRPPAVTSNSRDPVTTYARKVGQGKIIAGPHVRAACARHLSDLETGAARGLTFDSQLATRAIRFFPDMLRLAKGQHEGEPFVLLEWQAFVIGSLFGWINLATGLRRFRKAYIETAKGSGKSPLLAGTAMYMLIADGEPGAEIYFAATTKEQAKIPFGAADAFHRQNPEIGALLVKSVERGEAVRLTLHQTPGRKTYGFMAVITSDESQSGPIPHMVAVDELHEWPGAGLLNVLEAGFKGRRQPLMLEITNSGKRKMGVCWDHHEYARKVAHGVIADDTQFSYICAGDLSPDGKTEVDPFENPAEWIKTNPSLGQTIEIKYLEDMVRRARNVPSLEADVRRLNFCQWGWGENENPWISLPVWQSAGRQYTLSDLRGRRAHIGLDLSGGTTIINGRQFGDLTACVFLIEPDLVGEPWYLLPYFWLPDQGLSERADKENIPWLQWRREGWLHTCAGNVISYEAMYDLIIDVASNFSVVAAGRDPAMKGACDREIMAANKTWPWEWQDIRQGYITMGPAIKEMERRLVAAAGFQTDEESSPVVPMVHPRHPILTMCVANAMTAQDAAQNVKFEKARSRGRIDGIVAAANATALTLNLAPAHAGGFAFI